MVVLKNFTLLTRALYIHIFISKYLISRFKMITRQTIVFPIRSVLTRMENIVVMPIWAASDSVYSDIVVLICYTC